MSTSLKTGLTPKQQMLMDMTADQPAAKIQKTGIKDYGTKMGPVSDDEFDEFLKAIKSSHQYVKLVSFDEDK